MNIYLSEIFNEYFFVILYYNISKYCENNNSNIIRNVMVIIFRPNVLILVNISSIISQILGKMFCRHSTNVLCLLVVAKKTTKRTHLLQGIQ